jgi:uncharacterized protein
MTDLPNAEWPQGEDPLESNGQQALVQDRAPMQEPSLVEEQRIAVRIAVEDERIASEPPTPPFETQPAFTSPSVSFLEEYARRPLPPPMRFPNFADVGLVVVLLLLGWMASGALLAAALHSHLWGVSTIKQAVNDIHYALGSQAIWYLISFSGCLLLFPAIWHKGFFDGLEWHAAAAIRKRWRLISAAFACFALALVDGLLLPGPPDTPIDQVFRMPGAAWLLFAFGITMAPFFEEMGFRGFLLPAFCTAADWAAERLMHLPTPEPDIEGKTRWSIGAMAVGSLLTSIPFALMHAYQTGYSLGPFLLLVCVSLVLCWVRLSTRSLAASTLVHSSYNLLLFSLMLAGTGGFKHLDKM